MVDLSVVQDESPQHKKRTASSIFSITDDESSSKPSVLTSAPSSPCALSSSPDNDDDDVHLLRSVGLVFEVGEQHYDHRNKLHMERPARIHSIRQALEAEGLINDCTVLLLEQDQDNKQQQLRDEDYLRVHSSSYMKRLDTLSSSCSCCCRHQLDSEALQYASVFLTSHSVHCAKRAASAVCHLVERVCCCELDAGFCIVRPPGHHAQPALMGGYCIINNVATAAAYAKNIFKNDNANRKKICILDWDVHHGNGTQQMFYNDPDVLYVSVHRSNFYPFSGHYNEVGKDGRNVNIAWSQNHMGDDEYLAAFKYLVLPMLDEFDPDLVLISAGFDAAVGDLGECDVTPDCFGRLTTTLLLKDRKVVCVLEGGYKRSILGQCVVSVTRALLNGDDDDSEPIQVTIDDINPCAARNIRQTMDAHKPYWKFLNE